VKSPFNLFYLVEYCPHTPPAQGLGELKGRVSKAKSQYKENIYQGMWIRYELKCPSNIKCPEGKEKVHRNEMSSSEPQRKKKGGEKEKTELEGWVSTG